MPVLTEELATLCSDLSGSGKGHRWQVSCLDFHPSGSMLASGSWDKEVRIWELNNLETKYTLKGVHKTPITSLSWQKPSGKLLAVGSSDCTVSLWNSNTGKHLGNLQGHSGWILDVTFASYDECYLATGSWDGSIKIWDIETKSVSCTLQGHDKGVWSIGYKPTKGSTLLCSGSEDGTVKIWDTRDKRCIQTLDGGHSLPVYAVNWSSDGAMIASGSEDTKICIWEPTSGSLINTIKSHSGTVKGLHFNPQTQNMSLPVLASVGGYSMNLSDPRPGKKTDITSLSLHDIGKEVETVVISPDGSLIVTGGRDGNIILMTLMVPRLVPSFSGQGSITDYKRRQNKQKKGPFIKDITNQVTDEEEEEEEEMIDQLDDILSSPLQQEVVQNVSRLKRISRVATKEVELQDHSIVRKNVTAKSSRKRRITGKDVETPNMVAHLTSRNSRFIEEVREEEKEEEMNAISSADEEEEVLPIPTPPPSIIVDRNILLSDTGSEISEGLKFKDSTIFDDTLSETGTDDLESQFLEGAIPHSSTHNSLQYSSMDGNYSMLDHLDSSILLVSKQKKKIPKRQNTIECIPEGISASALSIATGSNTGTMDDDIEQLSSSGEEGEQEVEQEVEQEEKERSEGSDDKESLTMI